MWLIIKKCYRTYLCYTAVVAVILAVVRILLGSEVNVIFSIFSGLALFLTTFLALLSVEQVEEKHRGYSLLAVLPISDLEIVAAKFLPPLASAGGLTLFLLGLYATYPLAPGEASLIRSYFLLMAGSSLLLAGLIYIGIFSIGYTKFVIGLLSLTVALGFVPMLLLQGDRDRLGLRIDVFLSWMRELNWAPTLPLVLSAYLGIMFLALAIQRRREV